jgi:predicted small secreted protein
MKSTLMILIAAVFVLAGCNTFEGAGKDIQKAGEKIEDAAKKK